MLATSVSTVYANLLLYVGAPLLVAFLVWATRQIVRATRALMRLHEGFFGRKADPAANDPGAPGVMARLDLQDVALTDVRHEVMLNEGGSLRDTVIANQAAVLAKIDTMQATVDSGISERAAEWAKWRAGVDRKIARIARAAVAEGK